MADTSFVRAFQPLNTVELALTKAALEDMGAERWVIENEHYFTTGGGFLSHGDVELWVRVPAEDVEWVRKELTDRLRSHEPPDSSDS